jgi:hypothetical protein
VAQHHHEARAIAAEVVEIHGLLDGLGRFEKAIAGDLRPHIPRVRDSLVRRLIDLLTPLEQSMTAPATTIPVRFVSDYDATGEWTDRQYKSIGRAFDAIDALPEPMAAQTLLELVSSRLSPARQAEIARLISSGAN